MWVMADLFSGLVREKDCITAITCALYIWLTRKSWENGTPSVCCR